VNIAIACDDHRKGPVVVLPDASGMRLQRRWQPPLAAFARSGNPNHSGLPNWPAFDCMGGPIAFRTAAAVPDRVGAAASFHGGGLVTDMPNSPHLQAAKPRRNSSSRLLQTMTSERPMRRRF
jgi:hypothetical protein